MTITSKEWHSDPLPAAEPLPAGDDLQAAIIEATLAQQELDRQEQMKQTAARLAALQKAQQEEEARAAAKAQLEAALPTIAQALADCKPARIAFQQRLIALAQEFKTVAEEYHAIRAADPVGRAEEQLKALDYNYHRIGFKEDWNLPAFARQVPTNYPALAAQVGLTSPDLSIFPPEPGPITKVLIDLLKHSR